MKTLQTERKQVRTRIEKLLGQIDQLSAELERMIRQQSGKKPVRVTILSQSFTLLAKGDPREVERLAQSVDDLMLSSRPKSRMPTPPVSPCWPACIWLIGCTVWSRILAR